MDVLVTGGAGFLGKRLARALLSRGRLPGPDGREEAIDRLTLLDLTAASGPGDPRLRTIAGDMGDPELLRNALGEAGAVFHLAAVVSAQAEADFDLGMRVNLDATRLLLDACRGLPRPPRLVSTSSVAVYGGALPPLVTDETALRPQSSYGAEKAMGELLVSDYTRRGFVDGRVLRLPTVSVRPGKPNRAASSFASGIIREPLQGQEAVCPVGPETRLWLLSPRGAVAALLHGCEIPGEALGGVRSVNLPGVSVTVGEMVETLRQVDPAAAGRVRWERDPLVERIVGSWPGRWDTSRAEALGFRGDAGFDAIVDAFREDDLLPAGGR
ncbi:MAG TPA: D-erythronate dehydrogenase, partial [Anaeromyxobacteraceae bacterium]